MDDEHVLDLRCELFESIPEPLNRPKSYQKLIITDSDEPGDPDDALACTKLNACLSLRKKWISQHPAPPQDIIKTFDDVEHGTSLVAGEIKRLRSASVGMIPIHKLPKISTAPGSPSILSPRTHLATNSGSHDGEIMHLSRPHSELYLSPHPTTQTESELEIQALNTTTNTSTNATTSTLQISQRKDKGSTNNLTILPSLDSASVGGAALGPTDLHPDMLRRRFRPNYCIFERPILDRNMHGKSIKMIDGVIHVISIETDTPTFTVLPFSEFLQDYNMVRDCVHSGPVTSYSYMRLELLAAKFDLYLLLNSKREIDSQKAVPHRDFYNVRKVDTHVHHSACMNQKHLLRFIKHKLRVLPNEVVTFRDGKNLTLGEVFQSLGLTAYELSIDTLDMHAHDTFHRFDRFNLKYNPAGQSRLREIFLKTDNLIEGRYLADITKEVMKDLEASKYQLAEWRVSIYGRNINEWTKLAKWFYVNKLAHPNIRWLIQVPRLYQLYRASNEISSFAEMLHNIFHPLFEATLNPQDHVEITYFLQTIVGFDSVDDESRPEFGQLSQGSHSRGLSTPEEWKFCENPPYGYWMYYMYANICTLNQLRASRNMPTFQFRPHCGEAGKQVYVYIRNYLCIDLILLTVINTVILFIALYIYVTI